MARRKKKNNSRIIVARTFFGIVLAVLFLRLVDVHLVDRSSYSESGARQHKAPVKYQPMRGMILDSNGDPLAMNVPGMTVGVQKKSVSEQVVRELSRYLPKSFDHYFSEINSSAADYVELERYITEDQGRKVLDLDINGVHVSSQWKRYYPNDELACQLVGFTDGYGNGITGVENFYNRDLKGRIGKEIKLITARRRLLSMPGFLNLPAENGDDIYLTIDKRYQKIVQNELWKTLIETGADSGIVVAMNPSDGRVLALASFPIFDPNAQSKNNTDAHRLRPITDMYEPGSTFKPVLLSAVLNEGINTTLDAKFCENGEYTPFEETIHDDHPYKYLTLRDIIIKSSNIGMAKLAETTPRHIFSKYARAFGFGSTTGIDLRGERNGYLKSLDEWGSYTPLAMSRGYEVAVTPLQMCAFYSAIANGGRLVKPRIIDKIINEEGVVVYKSRPQIKRRVLKQAVADTMANILADVVRFGTGKKAFLENVEIAGKTGTSRIAFTEKGKVGYHKGRYISSFSGFFPKDNPQICMYVAVINPRKQYYGGYVSAPCFKNIAQRIVKLDGLEQNAQHFIDVETKQIMPNLVGQRAAHVENTYKKAKIIGNGKIVLRQVPEPGTEINSKTNIQLFCDQNTKNTMPNIIGFSVRQAISVLHENDIQAKIEGVGKVVSTFPQAGATIQSGNVVTLKCESILKLSML